MIWTQPTQSGLGDRFVDAVLLAGYARLKGERLYFRWLPYVGHYVAETRALDAPHRMLDSTWECVSKHVRFPSSIRLNEPFDTSPQFDHYVGGGLDARGFHQAHVKEFTLEEYQASVRVVLSEFSFSDDVLIRCGARGHVGVHIRRGDKVRAVRDDDTHMSAHELADLDARTYAMLDAQLAETPGASFFVCGDEDSKTQPFADYIMSRGGKLVTYSRPEKHVQTFCDMRLLSRSRVILTSMRYSSFSIFSAMLGDVRCVSPWRTLYPVQY